MLNILYTIIIIPLTQIIEFCFVFSQKIFKDAGLSLLFISFVISLLCLPIYYVAEKVQEKERDLQKAMKPKIDRIHSVFKGDERYLIISTFYRQNHYHPLYAIRSSLGFLFQIPFFIAAFSFISNLALLKGSHFLFIPDLGSPDKLLFYGKINFLPLLMTVINIVSGIFYTKGSPFKEKIQLYIIALIFLVLLYNSPAGLVVYWTMNNIFSLVKNIYYKIPHNNKKRIALLIFSSICLLLSFYLLKIYKGAIFLRILITCLLLISGLMPWLVFAFKKFVESVPLLSKQQFNLKPSFSIFGFSLVSLFCITGFFLPSMLIGASPQEFSFIDNYTTPLYFIGNTCLQALGLFVLWPLILYFLFGNRVKTFFTFLEPVFVLGSLINIFVFPGHYGIISLNLVFNSGVGHGYIEVLRNLLVLCIPVLLIYALYRLKLQKIIFGLVLICIISVSVFSFYNIYNINSEYGKVKTFHTDSSNEIETVDPIFHLSKTGKNTIVIMLDRAISVFIPYIFSEDKELNDTYSGFVYYPNTVSFGGYTLMGAPPLFGGYEYSPLEINKRNTVPLVKKNNEALLLMPSLFSNAGFDVTVTDPPYPNYSNKGDLSIYQQYPDVKAYITDSHYTKLWLKENNMSFPSTGDILKRDILWYSIFRISPLAFRQGIYLQGDWCATSLMQKIMLTLNGYSVLDYLIKLTDFKSETQNTASLMVNNITHEPSFLQAPDYRPVPFVTNYGDGPFNRETSYHVNIAALKRLGEWFNFLKSEGVYDNCRIIIVSDHGPEPNFLIKLPLPFNVDQFNPLLMVKDFQSKGKMKTDSTFMSNADVPYLAMNGQIEKLVNPFTGKDITTDLKSNPLYIAVSGTILIGDPNHTTFELDPKRDYYVHENIFDAKNWISAVQK